MLLVFCFQAGHNHFRDRGPQAGQRHFRKDWRACPLRRRWCSQVHDECIFYSCLKEFAKLSIIDQSWSNNGLSSEVIKGGSADGDVVSCFPGQGGKAPQSAEPTPPVRPLQPQNGNEGELYSLFTMASISIDRFCLELPPDGSICRANTGGYLQVCSRWGVCLQCCSDMLYLKTHCLCLFIWV